MADNSPVNIFKHLRTKETIFTYLKSNGPGLVFGGVLSVFAIYYAVKNVPMHVVWLSISSSDWRFISIALIFIILGITLKVIRWQILLKSVDLEPGFSKTLAGIIIGQLINMFILGRLGELFRAQFIGAPEKKRVSSIGTIIVEKILDTFLYISVIGILLVMIPLPDWVKKPVYSFLTVISFSSIIFILAAFCNFRLPTFISRSKLIMDQNWIHWLTRRLSHLLDSIRSIKDIKLFSQAIGFTVMIWTVAVFVNWFVLAALDLDLPISASILILIALQAGLSIPTIPGRFGIFEYTCVLVLSLYGIEKSLALSFGIILHAAILIPLFLFVPIFAWKYIFTHKLPNT